MEKYSLPNLPKGVKGAVDRNGDFYSFGSVNSLGACHDVGFRYLTLEVLKRDPRIRFEVLKNSLEHPEYYAVNYADYDFKALAIDFLGICNFAVYGTQLNNYAAIEVPNPCIAGFHVIREQQDTLIQLVKINHCSLESLRPIFSKEEYFTKYVKVKK